MEEANFFVTFYSTTFHSKDLEPVKDFHIRFQPIRIRTKFSDQYLRDFLSIQLNQLTSIVPQWKMTTTFTIIFLIERYLWEPITCFS